jgi:hypothetical protein
MRLGRHSTVTSAQRVELWRRYQAGAMIIGNRPRNGPAKD